MSASTSSASVGGAAAFACCSRYRACSDAKACLMPDQEYAKNCSYRAKLEAGTIYYGKNSIYFDPARYAQLQDTWQQLAEGEQTVFLQLLHYFFITKRAAASGVFFTMGEFSKLETLGLLHTLRDPSPILRKCRIKTLKSACADRLDEAEAWIKAQRKTDDEKERDKPVRSDELIRWMVHVSPDAVARACDGLTLLSLPRDWIFLLEEFYLEHRGMDDWTLPLLPQPFLEDPRFLAPR